MKGWARSIAITASIVLVLALLFLAFGGVELINRLARERVAADSVGDIGYEDQARMRAETVLVAGGSGTSTYGFAIIRADAQRATIYEIVLAPDILFCRSGESRGDSAAQRLDDMFMQDPALAVLTLSEHLKIPISHWVLVPTKEFSDAQADGAPTGYFKTLTKTSFGKQAFVDYRARVDSLGDGSVVSAVFPTRPVECNGTIYVEPHREQLGQEARDGWGVAVEELSAAPRVAVLNGTETKGLAGRVAERLVLRGFRIADIGNASHFSYDSSVVQVRPGFEPEASRVAQALGISIEEYGSVPSNSDHDVIVIVGGDYRSQ